MILNMINIDSYRTTGKSIFFLLALLVTMLCAGIFIGLKYQESHFESTTSLDQNDDLIPIDTSSWKTFKNDAIGFEITYPPNYEIVESPNVTGNSGAEGDA